MIHVRFFLLSYLSASTALDTGEVEVFVAFLVLVLFSSGIPKNLLV